VLGDAVARLHPAVADLHQTGAGRKFAGRCKITRGRNPLSHLVAGLFRFPKAGEDVAVTVEITPDATGELWVRNFGGRNMQSHHSPGTGRWQRHIIERFGPFRIVLAVLERAGQLHIETQGWSVFRLPLPRFLRPGGEVYETQDDAGRFRFHVDLCAPGLGRLVLYEGWLSPQD